MTDRQELLPDYMYLEQAAEYLKTTEKKIALFRKHGILKAGRLGKCFVYRKDWLNEFMDAWADYDLSNESKIIESIALKEWRRQHGYTDN